MYGSYYFLKPLIPRRLQIGIRRRVMMRKRTSCADIWPIDRKSNRPPDGWAGWPDQKQFALVLTHDVESAKGLSKCHELIRLEEQLGFRSSFNFVAEDYNVTYELRNSLTGRGLEVGIHGLSHDGNLFKSKRAFNQQAVRINQYLKEWGSVGFRAPSMYHHLDWTHWLNIEYDASTFDTDPFEPQPDGMKTIFPFVVNGNSSQRGYVELPYTLPQDFCLFIIMQEKTIDIWKRKLDWIAENGGMGLLITHPDYMNFDGTNLNYDEYPSLYYKNFLEYIKSRYDGQYWHPLPKEMAHFWRSTQVEGV
jgi:hypothetical protein